MSTPPSLTSPSSTALRIRISNFTPSSTIRDDDDDEDDEEHDDDWWIQQQQQEQEQEQEETQDDTQDGDISIESMTSQETTPIKQKPSIH